MFFLAKEGFPYLIGVLAVLVILLLFPTGFIIFLLALLFAFLLFYFRSPSRVPEVVNERTVLSPADGKVLSIREEGVFGGRYTRVSIVIGFADCHVNRVPYDGEVVSVSRTPGKFLHATDEQAHLVNEQNLIHLSTRLGDMYIRQIAGVLGRRCVCNLTSSSQALSGEAFGIIMFASRVDIYLPAGVRVLVPVGGVVRGGQTVLAESPKLP